MSIYDGNNLVTAREWHLYHVLLDPEFIEQYDATVKVAEGAMTWSAVPRSVIDTMTDGFGLTEQEFLGVYFHTLYPTPEFNTTAWPGLVSGEGVGLISFDKNSARDEDILKVFRELTRGRNPNVARRRQRRSGPENHTLIYKYFRLLKKGYNREVIFKLYHDEALPDYKGPYGQFVSALSLERYYRKYRPV